MSNIQNRLCNATGFLVELKWHAGIVIEVPPDGFVDLDVNQMDDFRDGKPGSEAVREIMDHQGVFLRDSDRTWEAQALEAVNASVRKREEHYNGVVTNLRRRRAAEGISENPEAFEEVLEQMGMYTLRDQIAELKFRRKFLSKHVEEEKKPVGDTYDPTRTLLFMDPPKVFPTAVAMEMFLASPGNELVKAEHDAFLKLNAEVD